MRKLLLTTAAAIAFATAVQAETFTSRCIGQNGLHYTIILDDERDTLTVVQKKRAYLHDASLMRHVGGALIAEGHEPGWNWRARVLDGNQEPRDESEFLASLSPRRGIVRDTCGLLAD